MCGVILCLRQVSRLQKPKAVSRHIRDMCTEQKYTIESNVDVYKLALPAHCWCLLVEANAATAPNLMQVFTALAFGLLKHPQGWSVTMLVWTGSMLVVPALPEETALRSSWLVNSLLSPFLNSIFHCVLSKAQLLYNILGGKWAGHGVSFLLTLS